MVLIDLGVVDRDARRDVEGDTDLLRETEVDLDSRREPEAFCVLHDLGPRDSSPRLLFLYPVTLEVRRSILALLILCDFLRRRALSGDFDLSYCDSRSIIMKLLVAPLEFELCANIPIVCTILRLSSMCSAYQWLFDACVIDLYVFNLVVVSCDLLVEDRVSQRRSQVQNTV